MLDQDGVDIAANSCVAVTEDAGDAFNHLPYAVKMDCYCLENNFCCDKKIIKFAT